MYYVSNMKNNILSMGQLLKKGYAIHLKDHRLFLRDQKKKLLIDKVKMSKNRMFKLNLQSGDIKYLKARIGDPFWLWHLRFWHFNFESLKSLAKKNMVKRLSFIDHSE